MARLQQPSFEPQATGILVVSTFNGIGGAFRAYDLAGLRAHALVSIELRGPSGLFKSCGGIEVSDINLVDLEMVKGWANARVSAVHLWGGFPCVSS